MCRSLLAIALLGNHHVRDQDRGVQCVVKLVALEHSRRGEHVHRFRHRVWVDCAVWIAARSGAHAKAECAGGGAEAARLVRTEPVLPGEHHREAPAAARVLVDAANGELGGSGCFDRLARVVTLAALPRPRA